jgi:hypothetical protein
LVNFDFGDGTNITTSDFVYNYSYTTWNANPGFALNVTAWNNVSSSFISEYIVIQKPVDNFAGFRVWGDPEHSTEEMQLYMTMENGTDFNCSWYLNDSIPETVKNTNYGHYLTGNFPQHQFEPGTYNITVKCFNRLYTTETTA